MAEHIATSARAIKHFATAKFEPYATLAIACAAFRTGAPPRAKRAQTTIGVTPPNSATSCRFASDEFLGSQGILGLCYYKMLT